jgi:hypothetical protein
MKARGLVSGLVGLLVTTLGGAQTTVDLEGELAFWVGDRDVSRTDDDGTVFFGPSPEPLLALDELSPRENARARRLTLGVGTRQPLIAWNGDTTVRVRFGIEPEPGSGRLRLRDQGSHLALEQRGGAKTRSFLLFPLDGDEVRAGWLDALAWGGEAGALGDSPYARADGLVPALVVSQRAPGLGYWVGVKAARLDVAQRDGFERESLEYGLLGGVTYAPVPSLELGLSGGALRHGAMTQPDVRGEALVTAGASARAVWRSRSSAPELGGVFPNRVEGLPDGELGVALSLEVAWLRQRLKQAEFERLVRWVPARGGAALAAVAFGRVELVTGALVREAAFVTRQGPGALLPEASPRERPSELEWTLVLEGRFGLASFLTGSLDFGLRRPAFELVPGAAGQGTSALVIRGPNRVELLSPGAVPLPELEARGALSIELSRVTSAALFVEYRRDANQVDFERRSGDVRWVRAVTSPHSLGYGLAVRSRL